MKPIVKVLILVAVAAGIIIAASCSNHQPALSQQQLDAVSQARTDFLKLEERVKMLENQNKALNDEIYQLNNRTEALEEVYDYVARDNEMSSTGEEPPAD